MWRLAGNSNKTTLPWSFSTGLLIAPDCRRKSPRRAWTGTGRGQEKQFVVTITEGEGMKAVRRNKFLFRHYRSGDGAPTQGVIPLSR